MQVAKLRVPSDENGLVPAGTYFQRLAAALREANERAGNMERENDRAVARRPRPEAHAAHF